MTAPRIGLNDDGSLDELVSRDVESFHFEAMGDAQFWMVVRCRDGHEYTINCGAVNPRARGYCTLGVDQ